MRNLNRATLALATVLGCALVGSSAYACTGSGVSVSATGNRNGVSIASFGPCNSADIDQRGSNNDADVDVIGSRNDVQLTQLGRNHRVAVWVRGQRNHADVFTGICRWKSEHLVAIEDNRRLAVVVLPCGQ